MLRDLFFQSATPIIRLGRTRPLTSDDAPPLPPGLRPEEASASFSTLSTQSFRHFVLSVFWATGGPARRVLTIITIRNIVMLATPVLLHSVLSQLPSVCRISTCRTCHGHRTWHRWYRWCAAEPAYVFQYAAWVCNNCQRTKRSHRSPCTSTATLLAITDADWRSGQSPLQ